MTVRKMQARKKKTTCFAGIGQEEWRVWSRRGTTRLEYRAEGATRLEIKGLRRGNRYAARYIDRPRHARVPGPQAACKALPTEYLKALNPPR